MCLNTETYHSEASQEPAFEHMCGQEAVGYTGRSPRGYTLLENIYICAHNLNASPATHTALLLLQHVMTYNEASLSHTEVHCPHISHSQIVRLREAHTAIIAKKGPGLPLVAQGGRICLLQGTWV